MRTCDRNGGNDAGKGMQHFEQSVAWYKAKQGGWNMLRMSMAKEEYLMIGDDIRIVFLGGSGNHVRIMVDAPKDVDVVRSTVLEKQLTDPELRAKLPKYHAEPEYPEKYKGKQKEGQKKKSGVIITRGNGLQDDAR